MEEDIYVARRRKMVMELERNGITDKRVLEAINKVPRHLFMPKDYLAFSYENAAYPIGCGQTISQPLMVATQTQYLNIQKGEKVLEIGTGSGYQSAVLMEMGASLVTIERQVQLCEKTAAMLKNLYPNVECICGDGYQGYPQNCPYDKIIVTAGASEMPKELLKQLKIGGKMIIPIGTDAMTLFLITRLSEKDFSSEKKNSCAFVPMLNGVENKPL